MSSSRRTRLHRKSTRYRISILTSNWRSKSRCTRNNIQNRNRNRLIWRTSSLMWWSMCFNASRIWNISRSRIWSKKCILWMYPWNEINCRLNLSIRIWRNEIFNFKYSRIWRLYYRTKDHHRRYKESNETNLKRYPRWNIRKRLLIRHVSSWRTSTFQSNEKISCRTWIRKSRKRN